MNAFFYLIDYADTKPGTLPWQMKMLDLIETEFLEPAFGAAHADFPSHYARPDNRVLLHQAVVIIASYLVRHPEQTSRDKAEKFVALANQVFYLRVYQ